jgi:hypothetical protein
MSEEENLRIARRVYEVLAGGLNEQVVLSLLEMGLSDPHGGTRSQHRLARC